MPVRRRSRTSFRSSWNGSCNVISNLMDRARGIFPRALSLFSLILPAGGKAAADMPLGLVYIQEQTHLFIKPRIDPRKPLCQILMYCGFACAKFLCRTAYRGSVCRNIFSKQHTSFLFGSIHCSHPIKFFCSNLYAVAYLIIT